MNVTPLLEYLPVAVYLTAVWILQIRKTPVPAIVHIAGAVTGMVVTALLINWYAPLISAAFALIFFVLAVAVAGKYMTRTGIITFSVALAAVPPVIGWIGLIAGVFLAAVVGTIRIARTINRDHALFTVYESASSLGINGAALPTKGVDTERIPAPTMEEQADPEKPTRSVGRMRLTPYMLIGVVAAAILTATGVV